MRKRYGNIKIKWRIYLMHKGSDGRIVKCKEREFLAGPQIEAITKSVAIASRWVQRLKKDGKKGSVVWELSYSLDLFGYHKILGLNGEKYNAEISF